jgi:hypothetical protein
VRDAALLGLAVADDPLGTVERHLPGTDLLREVRGLLGDPVSADNPVT